MRIAEVMTRNVSTINLDTPLCDAAARMRTENIGALPVIDGEKIRGMLTDRDIVIRAAALGKDLSKTTARDAMTEKIRYVFDDEDVNSAADHMSAKQIRRLVVLNRAKRLVGFVSMADICREADDGVTAGVARCCSEKASEHLAH